ncbi:hypothetical protein K3495_g13940 [Podosphaera aphanis]|nr:hypothetical protein K3495_g13940 [Podosphaera aphanis]
MGMPCWHIIQERMSQSRGLTINDFHQHWHFDRPQPNFQQLIPDPPILDPVIRQQRRTEESGRRAHARAHSKPLNWPYPFPTRDLATSITILHCLC